MWRPFSASGSEAAENTAAITSFPNNTNNNNKMKKNENNIRTASHKEQHTHSLSVEKSKRGPCGIIVSYIFY